MSKFKVGDKVRAIEAYSGCFEAGAEGEVLIPTEEDGTLLIQFKSGNFTNANYGGERTTGKGQWWTRERRVELINQEKESNMKKSEGWGLGRKEGDGICVTAWGVEVDGKLHPDMVSKSRSNARENRNYFASYGKKAVVRKVQIKVLEGKI